MVLHKNCPRHIFQHSFRYITTTFQHSLICQQSALATGGHKRLSSRTPAALQICALEFIRGCAQSSEAGTLGVFW